MTVSTISIQRHQQMEKEYNVDRVGEVYLLKFSHIIRELVVLKK